MKGIYKSESWEHGRNVSRTAIKITEVEPKETPGLPEKILEAWTHHRQPTLGYATYDQVAKTTHTNVFILAAQLKAILLRDRNNPAWIGNVDRMGANVFFKIKTPEAFTSLT